jgi:hypothetical protein
MQRQKDAASCCPSTRSHPTSAPSLGREDRCTSPDREDHSYGTQYALRSEGDIALGNGGHGRIEGCRRWRRWPTECRPVTGRPSGQTAGWRHT